MKVSPPLLPPSVTVRVRRKEEREGAGLTRSPRLTHSGAGGRAPRRAWRPLHSGCASLGDAAAQPLTPRVRVPRAGPPGPRTAPCRVLTGPGAHTEWQRSAPMPAPSPTRLPTGRLQTQWRGPGLPRMAGRDPAPPTAAASERLAPQPTVAGGSPRVLRPQTVALGLSRIADFSQTCSEKRRSRAQRQDGELGRAFLSLFNVLKNPNESSFSLFR